jgi:hypothetical protein
MTTQEAIAKAIEGGYTAYKPQGPSWPIPEQYFLDTSFWEALGRTLEWKPESLWQSYWDRFIIHLTQGKSLESFFVNL